MKTQCQYCGQEYEVDEEYQLRQVECSACGNSFIVPKEEKRSSHRIEINKFAEQGEPHKSKKLKWFLIIIALVGFLSIIGVSLFSVIDPILKVNKFKEEFTIRQKDKMRDPESMTIDWKFAGTDKKGDKFLALCVVRAKNAIGGYSEPDYLKVVGGYEGGEIKIPSFKTSEYNILHSRKMTFDKFYQGEEEKCIMFYKRLEDEASLIILQAEKDIKENAPRGAMTTLLESNIRLLDQEGSDFGLEMAVINRILFDYKKGENFKNLKSRIDDLKKEMDANLK